MFVQFVKWFTNVQKVIKDQWARDDPAFIVILAFFMLIAGLAYALAFSSFNILNILKLLLWMVGVDFVFVGILIASVTW